MKEPTIKELEDGLLIDEDELMEMCAQHHILYYKVAVKLATLISQRDAAKQELSEIEAEEDGKQRRLAAKKDEKTTETEIKQKVKTSKPVTDAVATMLSLNEQVGKVSALKEAYSKRSYSLSNMVDLHIRMYMGEATTNRTEANVRDAKASSARAQLSQRRRNQEED